MRRRRKHERLPRLHAFAAIGFGLAMGGGAGAQTTPDIWPGDAGP